MKTLSASLLALCLATSSAFAASAGKLHPVVSVDLGSALLGFAGTCAATKDQEAADVIKNLKRVNVRVFECGDIALSEIQAAVKAEASVALNSDWNRIVTVNKPNEALVEVHVKMKNADVVSGVVITVANQEHQGVLVEIEGDLRADQIQKVVNRLPIDGLPKGALAKVDGR